MDTIDVAAAVATNVRNTQPIMELMVLFYVDDLVHEKFVSVI